MNMLVRRPLRLPVEIVFDLICPWCWIGIRRLGRALAERPDLIIDLRFRPFLLNPDMPSRGMTRADYVHRKFGGEERARRLHAAIAEVGRAEGLDLRFDRISRTPATVDPHRLVRLAAAEGRGLDAAEAIFTAHFVEARDIGDRQVLAGIATELGLTPASIVTLMQPDRGAEAVTAENLMAHRLGINGVPCFVIAGRHAIAGAQEPEVLVRLLDVAAMEAAGLA